MTISSTNRKSGPFLGTGLVSEYPFNFVVFDDADLVVVRADDNGVEATLALGFGYTVSLNEDQDSSPGGEVVLAAPLPSGHKLVITSDIEALQPTDLTNQGGFYPQVITRSLDRLTIIAQQLKEQVGRAVITPISSSQSGQQYLDTLVDAIGDQAANAATTQVQANLAWLDTRVDVAEEQIRNVAGSFNPRGLWATATAYSAGTVGSTTDRRDVVLGPDGEGYVVLVSHVSGVFADDVAAGKLLNTDAAQLAMDLVTIGDSKGADIPVYQSPVTGALIESVAKRLGRQLFFTGDNTGGTNETSRYVQAVEYLKSLGGGRLHIPAGDWWIQQTSIGGCNGIHIEGAGMGVTRIQRKAHIGGSAFRFFNGTNNSVSNLTIHCNDFSGQGVAFRDIDSIAYRVEVLDCPDRPFSLNGGGNVLYGTDVNGRNSDEVGFLGASFFPAGCRIIECKVFRCGRTALSQKQMPYSIIAHNTVRLCYAEGVTLDWCDHTKVMGNIMIDIARKGRDIVWPDEFSPGDVGGGIGGVGFDGSSYAIFSGNTIDGVELNEPVIENRGNAAINLKPDLAPMTGCVITENIIRNTKLAILFNGAFQEIKYSTCSNNVFENTGTSGISFWGDIWIGPGCTGNRISSNVKVGGNMLFTDLAGGNDVTRTGTLNMTVREADFSSAVPSAVARFSISNGVVSLEIPTFSGTSASTELEINEPLPIGLRPSVQRIVVVRTRNSTDTYGTGLAQIDLAGKIRVKPTSNFGSAFSDTGVKAVLQTSVSYEL